MLFTTVNNGLLSFAFDFICNEYLEKLFFIEQLEKVLLLHRSLFKLII